MALKCPETADCDEETAKIKATRAWFSSFCTYLDIVVKLMVSTFFAGVFHT
jgi:hypothetical protein